MPENIYKAYDIRGIYPTDLNEDIAFKVGLATAQLAKQGKVVVGRDMRVSSPQLHQSLIDGLLAGGSDVFDLELVPIDALYYAVGTEGYDAGVMVTASHNPAAYNGFKVVGKGVSVIRGVEIQNIIENGVDKADKPGSFSQVDIWDSYISHVLSFVDKEKFKPLKLVIDAGNGMAGLVIPKLFNYLPFKVEPLFFELDGSFPNRPSNPLASGAADFIKQKVLDTQADCGIMFDGDTDRVFFVDEAGEFVPADVTLLMLAKSFLQKEPGAAIVYNLICSKAVPEFIEQWGGRPVRSAVGYVNMRLGMIGNKAAMSGELSAHYSFRENFNADSGFIAALLVLQVLSQSDGKLSSLVKSYAPYAKAPETNLNVRDTKHIIEKLTEHYKSYQHDNLDGLSVVSGSWWFNVRPSNTEPLIRITVEADTADELKIKHEEIINLVKKYDRSV